MTQTTQEGLEQIAKELRPLARPLESLREDPKNARVHGEENVRAIEASLRAHGQRKPIVVKEGYVLAGNGTLRAARRLGWESLACVEYEGPLVLARAFAIADNRSAEQATWDPEVLALALEEADAQGLLEATAWGREEADELLGQALAEAAGEAEDPGPEEPSLEPVSKPGELYLLGPHRLLCGDATNKEDVARLMEGKKAALCATDPPYVCDYTGVRHEGAGKDWSKLYQEIPSEDAESFFRAVFANVLLATREDAAIYCWHAHKRQALISKVWAELGILDHQQIVWVKPKASNGFSFWPYRHEPCLMGWRKGNKPEHDGENSHEVTSVWEIDWDGKKGPPRDAEHPTQKPLEIFGIPIRKHTKPGEVVFEPFLGSGSQLVAAAKEGRRCFGLEISPAFCDAIRRRFTKFARSSGGDPGSGALS